MRFLKLLEKAATQLSRGAQGRSRGCISIIGKASVSLFKVELRTNTFFNLGLSLTCIQSRSFIFSLDI